VPAYQAAGPAWWVEAVEYPAGLYPRVFVPFVELRQPLLPQPAAPTVVSKASGGLSGTYLWRVTFLGVAGETASSPASAPATLAAQQATITVPLGPAPWCQGRTLYRTPANGADGSQLLVATIADNATTCYSDNLADGSLGVPLPAGDSTASAPIVELPWPTGSCRTPRTLAR
jgi:hypothetical protein